MQGLKSDELGFLVGNPISLTDLHDELAGINGELSEIKEILSKDAVVGITPDSIDEIVGGFAANIVSENEKSSTKAPENISVPASRGISNQNTGVISRLDQLIAGQLNQSVQTGGGATQHPHSLQARDSNGRFISPVQASAVVKVSENRDRGSEIALPGARNNKSNDPGKSTNQTSIQNTTNHTIEGSRGRDISASTQAITDSKSRDSVTHTEATKDSKSSKSQESFTHIKAINDSNSFNSSETNRTVESDKTRDSVATNEVKQDSRIRDSNGRFISKSIATETVSIPKSRAANGQFLPKETESKSESEKNSIGTKIKNVGSSIVDSIGSLGADNEQADPSVQAMGEIKGVLTPVGRGLGKLFGGSSSGVNRGQDRWYRRFFKQNADKARVDELAHKREQKLLSDIEKKEAPEVGSSTGLMATLFLAFMGALAGLLIKGFQVLATPLKFLGLFFAPLLKVLQALLRAVGLKKLADRLGSPTSATNKKAPGSPKPTPAGTAGSPKAGTGSKALLKKLPIVGALLSAGFLGKELYDISANDESKDTKTKQVGSAVGSTVGGLGGALGGAAAGAAVGSVVPVVGTLVGGIVGAVLGGIGGDKLGGILGDKFGDWVNDLRDSGFIDRMSRTWDVGVNAMSIMWRDFTSLASSVWSGMVAGVQGGWNAVTNLTQLMWQNVQSGFTTATDFIKSSWQVATSVVGGALGTVWAGLGELAAQVNEAIKAKTGIDIAKNVKDLKATVAGWGDSLKTAFSDFSENVKNKLGEVFDGSYLGGVINEAQQMSSQKISTTKEQDANQSGVLNAFLKAGFSKNQAVALTAEVGRENDYNSKDLYGYHKDAANGKVNMGMISWQGDRAKRLEAHMQSKGLIKNGKMVQNQAALDAQAEFVKWEIDNNSAYSKTKQAFANNPSADPEAYAKTLGTNYVRWAYGQNKLSNGTSFNWEKHDDKRRAYKEKAQAKSTTATSTAIPFRPGYNAQTAQAAVNETKAKNEQAKAKDGAKVAPAAQAAPETTVAAVQSGSDASNEVKTDPNSIENLMQTFNSFDGMASAKQAIVTMLKSTADGKTVAHHAPRQTPVVPAVSVNAPMQIADAPKVNMPLASSAPAKDSNRSIDDVSRDLSDRRIAHIVTGAYSSPT